MAFYKLIGAQHAELDDGTKLGFDNSITSATFDGRTLKKGQGAIHLVETASTGKALGNGRKYSFSYGETIVVGA